MNTKTLAYRPLKIEFQQSLIRTGNLSTCTNCIYWSTNINRNAEPRCSKYKVVPPPDVIVVGCEEWEMDIPF
nr:hypothetical protein ART_00085 [Achromobacter phage vB_Ade_ART]